jgi:hypothetical protein
LFHPAFGAARPTAEDVCGHPNGLPEHGNATDLFVNMGLKLRKKLPTSLLKCGINPVFKSPFRDIKILAETRQADVDELFRLLRIDPGERIHSLLNGNAQSGFRFHVH